MGRPTTFDSESQELFESMLDTIPGYVSWLSSDLTYLGVNRAVSETFGVAPGDFQGKPLGFLLQEEYSFAHHARKFFRSDKSSDSFEVSMLLGEKKVWQLVQAKKYKNGTEAIFIGIDITEKKRMEQALEDEQNLRIQAAKMASLGEMAASIAHEINSPLTVIQGNAELVETFIDDKTKILHCADKIKKTVSRITKIIKSMRTYSRNSQMDPFEAYSLQEIIEDSLELCRKRMVNADIEFSMDKIPVDFKFECRPTQISQILVNLINNACDAVDLLANKWVKIEFRPTSDSFTLAVLDSGPGIPETVRERLMQPFFTTKAPGKGTGLGLSLSRRIVEDHNGKFYVDDKSPNTKFVVEIPVRHNETLKSPEAA